MYLLAGRVARLVVPGAHFAAVEPREQQRPARRCRQELEADCAAAEVLNC